MSKIKPFKSYKDVKRRNRQALEHIRNLMSNRPVYSGISVSPGSWLQLDNGLNIYNSGSETVYLGMNKKKFLVDKT